MARQDRVDDLRHDGVVVADDAGKERRRAAQALDQVVADFVLDGAAQDAAGGDVCAKLAEGCGPRGHGGYERETG